jgi:hypothetical protein
LGGKSVSEIEEATPLRHGLWGRRGGGGALLSRESGLVAARYVVAGKGRSAFFRFALAVFEALDKLLDNLGETFGDGNLPHTVAVLPEPPSEARSNLTAGRGFV